MRHYDAGAGSPMITKHLDTFNTPIIDPDKLARQTMENSSGSMDEAEHWQRPPESDGYKFHAFTNHGADGHILTLTSLAPDARTTLAFDNNEHVISRARLTAQGTETVRFDSHGNPTSRESLSNQRDSGISIGKVIGTLTSIKNTVAVLLIHLAGQTLKIMSDRARLPSNLLLRNMVRSEYRIAAKNPHPHFPGRRMEGKFDP